MPPPAPPWRQVIATTIRLWWQRHARRPALAANPDSAAERLAIGPGPSRQPRTSPVLKISVPVLLFALIAVSVIAFQRSRADTSDPARTASSAGPAVTTAAGTGQRAATASDSRALRAAAQARELAAAWVAAQVGHNVIVACDSLMCAALQQHGFPAADLAPIGPGTQDPLGSAVVISTLAVRTQLGPQLTKVYAPMVIASFGTGQALVQVLVAAPDGAAAYLAAEQSDARARAAAGQQLLHNKHVLASRLAARQLAAGQVDSRLLITLAALASKYTVDIRSFSDAGPGAAPGAPLRAMTVTTPTAGYLSGVLAFLRAQRGPLLALTSVTRSSGTTVLHIEFTAPSPTGLLGQS